MSRRFINPFTHDEKSYAQAIEKSSKPRAKPRDLEFEEQCKVIHWCIDAIKYYPELSLLIAMPNGEEREHRTNKYGQSYSLTGNRLKSMGVKAGFPDLMLLVPRKVDGILYHGLLIEMKAVYCDFSTTTGKPLKPRYAQKSPEQESWHRELSGQGFYVTTCYYANTTHTSHGEYTIKEVGAIDTIIHYLGIKKL